MTQWYFASHGEQLGPMAEDRARDYAGANPGAYCWRSGFAGWQKVADTQEFADGQAAAGPPPLRQSRGGADEVDFKIYGSEMQFVEIELDPGEGAIPEAGALMYKDKGVAMDTVFGDGSNQDEGLMGKVLGGVKRAVTGESLFMTIFHHQGQGKAKVAFAAPYPGNVLALNLADLGGTLICQKDSFLAGAKGVQVGVAFQKRILTGLFGGEGFILQRLDGDGWVFVHAGGTLWERELAAGEELHVDTGCLAALAPSVDYDIEMVKGIKSAFFGGEGLFFARLRGPGKVWLQSLPFSRMAGRMMQAAPQGGGQDRGQGSLLGGIGDLVGGDRNW